jgi:orotidine-5'-phosphate decarboxylase
MSVKSSPLILALDVEDQAKAIKLCFLLRDKIKIFKVGLQLFLSEGKSIVEAINSLGGEVFLDLKFHDIPNQVANACVSAARMNVKMLTVHTSGGLEMMKKARGAVENLEIKNRPLLLGVTVLTSFNQELINEIGINKEITEQVVFLAGLAQKAGLDGVVASPFEINAIRENCGDDFLIVTPGIRYDNKSADDQKRVLSPSEAMKFGADYLVIGRPILKAEDPLVAVENILREIGD